MKKRWSTLIVAFTVKNVAMGVTFGCFGLLLPVLVEEFATGVATLSLAIALVSLVMGFSAPLIGSLLDRWSIAGTVTAGCLLGAAGFALAAEARSAWQFVLLYGVVAGLGITAMGAQPAAKLAAVAFPAARGKAIGFAMLPLSGVVAPLLCGPLLVQYGWRVLLSGFAAALLLLALLSALLVMRVPPGGSVHDAALTPVPPQRGIFFQLALAAGLLLSSGILLVTYIAPHARNMGMDTVQAATLLALIGGTAIPGAYCFAWLADRIAPERVLACNAALQVVLWLALAWLPAGFGLWLAAAVLGLCAGGANPAFSVCIAALYGPRRLGTMLGRLALAVVPFNVAVTPLAGRLFDVFGDYRRMLLVEALLCAIATVLLLRLRSHRLRDSGGL